MTQSQLSCGFRTDQALNDPLIEITDKILVTGANGFIGSRVVWCLLSKGFRNIRCLLRSEANIAVLRSLEQEFRVQLEYVWGNLQSTDTCKTAASGALAIYHLAVGTDKSFPGCVMNTVVTTRNLLQAVATEGCARRFVNVSSLAIYSNDRMRRHALLDECCPVEADLVGRYDPYAYAKAKQDELVRQYARNTGIPYVMVRPGVTFGPGKTRIPGRVGIDTFGVFLHLGHANQMPLTYVDNCAEAIVAAGLVKGIDSEEFNIVDDNLPTSREFLRHYKKETGSFLSIPVPYNAFYMFCFLWEKYSSWSQGQLPPVFNRKTCLAYYKGNTYSNNKAKRQLHWNPRVNMTDALARFFAAARAEKEKA
jgi:nucleoside-diphosphate-sugar epimerase